MDDFSEILTQLQRKAEKISQSERHRALDFLKKIITDIEQIDRESIDEDRGESAIGRIDSAISATTATPAASSVVLVTDERMKEKAPLKLTIRKFTKSECVFKCQECGRRFAALPQMISHVLASHPKAEVTCCLCKGTFHSPSLLQVHECLYSRQTVFIRRLCGICDKLSLKMREFELHMKDCHMIELEKRLKSFSCSYCDSSFKWRSQLLVHISKRHKEAFNKEKIAQRIRFNLLKKNVHKQTNESVDDKKNNSSWRSSKYSCSICKRNFLSQRALERHSLSYMHRMRTGELKLIKKFICDVCNSSFIKLNCLQRHMTSHQTDLPHKCNLCDYRTSEKCNLTEHMRRHYQIRNYICEFCDARFIAKRELKDHVAFKHNTIRPYECLDCGKMFKTKRILTRHNKIHSNFRPYVCACGSNFLRMTNLRRHIIGVHHDSNPSITKVQVPVDKSDVSNDITKPVWFADSKFIKMKKITALTLIENDLPEKVVKKKVTEMKKVSNKLKSKEEAQETHGQPIIDNSNNQMLSINFMIKVSEEEDKDPKLYSNINQDFLYQSDNSDKYLQSSNSPTGIPVINGIISNKSSLQDSSTIDDSMNICDLVTSPSYPLLETVDQSDDTQTPNKLSYDISIKSENLSNYKVESIMMESENRNNLDGIWRPIDTVDQDQNIIDDNASSLVSNSIDMFPPNSGLISSFNEVFLSSVSNNCYTDDNVHWNSLSLGNPNSFNGDNSNFIITGTMSACEPLSDNMTVSDSTHAPADNFLFYNNPPQQQSDHNPHQSFAYIESYSSAINLDHNYGSINDMANISFCTGVGNSSFQQTINSTHMQDLFPISYSSTSHSDYISNSTNNTSLSNMLFNSDQPFFSNSSTISTINIGNSNQPNWLHGPHSPLNDFSAENLPPALLDSYKLTSQINISSSGSTGNSLSHHPPRILSPIDFLVSDSVFPTGNKHEFCLSLHDIPSTNDLHGGINDNPLISDFCSQSHQYQHTSGQLCSKNFSVVNLISSGCASHNSTKESDDIELLYS